jgi:hypothetical protein
VKDTINGKVDTSSARRRLIRGAFAAPAALTLYSGSVAAGSLSCVAAVVNHQPVDSADGSSTTYLRVPLRVLFESGTSDKILAKFVSAQDLAMLAEGLAVSSYLSPDEWQCVYAAAGSGSTNPFEAGHIYNSGEIEASSNGQSPEMNGSSEYVAVRVSADGNILGVQGFYDDEGAVKTSAMAVSCWCSFGGVAPFNGM